MADAITIQELIDARTDAKTLEEAVNGDAVTTVLSRLGESYPTLANALSQIDGKLDDADAQIRQAIIDLFENGGLPATPFATKALMTASSLSDGNYAVVTDDDGNNGLYIKESSGWVKSGYDKLGLKALSGNIVPHESVIMEKKGLSGKLEFKTDNAVDSAYIKVEEGEVLYLRYQYSSPDSNVGALFAFFDFVDEGLVSGSSSTMQQIEADLKEFRDDVHNVSYIRAIVPKSAKFLVLNIKFKAEIDWVITRDDYNYSGGDTKLVVSSIGGTDVGLRLTAKQRRELLYSYNTVEQFDEYKVTSGHINGAIFHSVGSTTNPHSLAYIEVVEGESYYILNKYGLKTPFKLGFSATLKNPVLIEPTYSDDTEFPYYVDLQSTDMKDVYKVQVPVGIGVKYLFLSLKVYSGDSPLLDLTDSLSIQKGSFLASEVKTSKPSRISLFGYGFADNALRKHFTDNVPLTRAEMDAPDITNTWGRLKGEKFYTFGDSITQGTEGGYVKYIEQATGAVITNYGVNASKAARLVNLMTEYPARVTGSTMYPTPDYTDVAAISIMIGTNDSTVSDPEYFGDISMIPKGTVYDSGSPVDYFNSFPNNYVCNIALCIEYVKWKNPRTEIHLISPPPRYRDSISDPNDYRYRTKLVKRLTPLLKSLCDEYGCHFIDGTSSSGIGYKDMNPVSGAYTYDGTHFNELGNEVFGKYIAQKILNYG